MTTRLRAPQHRVSPRAVPMWTLSHTVSSILITAVLIAAVWGVVAAGWSWVPAWLLERAWWIPVLYAGYALVKTVVAPRWRYRVHRWEVTADVVYTRTGWLSRAWQLVPVGRIQTVDTTQGWLERMFRLATLRVQTASYAGSSTIEGLDAAEAQRISEELALRVGDVGDDAT
ncbi:PH domain-containing protein [Lipingzhangella halophila]|nr:PH domain-containing protein [Lipingzhangella halophila]